MTDASTTGASGPDRERGGEPQPEAPEQLDGRCVADRVATRVCARYEIKPDR
jgi:hypothetical protein